MRTVLFYILIIFCLSTIPYSYSDIKDDIDFDLLQAELLTNTPTGAGIAVTQVEANEDQTLTAFLYAPVITGTSTNTEFINKNFIDESNQSTGISGHAITVARNLYGNQTSIAPGINQISNYLAGDWLAFGFLEPRGREPLIESNRIQNHSWISTSTDDSSDINKLQRLDYAINRDGFLAVVGLNNGTGNVIPNILAASYNAISVGRSDGNHSGGTTLLDTSGRTKPEIVVPATATSFAAPVVSAAAALLMEVSDNNLSLSQIAGNATKPETLRAILLAGATKDEFSNWGRSRQRPLDETYGAGELNIYNSYKILKSGEISSSTESAPIFINNVGWDFGQIENSSNRRYFIEIPQGKRWQKFSIILTWNRTIQKSGFGTRWTSATSTLSDLSLRLFNADNLQRQDLLDDSDSLLDNYEHIYRVNSLTPGQYVIEVVSSFFSQSETDYSIAWHSESYDSIETYAEWQKVKFDANRMESDQLTGADPDRDGIINLTEYALNLNPDIADSENLPKLIQTMEDMNGLATIFSYNRISTAKDLTYTIMTSPDLAFWNQPDSESIEVIVVPSEITSLSETVNIRLKDSLPDMKQLFLRLEISLQ